MKKPKNKQGSHQRTLDNHMVRMKGLEPPRLAAPDPKSGASANSATSALENIQEILYPHEEIISTHTYFSTNRKSSELIEYYKKLQIIANLF